jgi:glutaredoxin
MTSNIIVYTLPICPNCDVFKSTLTNNDVKYITKDLEDDETRMELLMDCVTLVEAPIIKIDNQYFDPSSAYKELGINV